MTALVAIALAALGAGRSQGPGPVDAPWNDLWNAGERIAAVEAMADALDEHPADGLLRLALVEREIAIHRYSAALAHAGSLGADAAPLRGVCLHRLGRYDEALAQLDPERPEHALLVLDALETLGREEELSAALETAARVLGTDHPEVHAWRGRALARAGDHAGAVAEFRAALAADPILLAAHFGLGQSLLRMGERDEARTVLERHRALVPLVDRRDFALQSLDLAPRNAPNHAQLGDVERALGRPSHAEAAYERALDLATPVQLAPIALRLARLLDEDLDDADGAVRVLDETAGRVADPRLSVRAGDVLLARGRAAEAVTRYEAAQALRPSDTAIRDRLERAKSLAADRE